MINRPEVKILTWGPDAGNPTPMGQGLCTGALVPSRRDANAARPAREGLVEVVGARPSKRERSTVKALAWGEPAYGGKALYAFEMQV